MKNKILLIMLFMSFSILLISIIPGTLNSAYENQSGRFQLFPTEYTLESMIHRSDGTTGTTTETMKTIFLLDTATGNAWKYVSTYNIQPNKKDSTVLEGWDGVYYLNQGGGQ